MTILDQAHQLANAGRMGDAVALVERAAGAADAEAQYALANWRLFGLNGPRDLKKAHELLRRAGEQGHVEAQRTRAFLLNNGTGCTADEKKATKILARIRARDPYSALQLAFHDKMKSEGEISRLPVEILSDKPAIRAVRGLLNAEECRYVMTLAKSSLEPSYVIDPRTGGRMPHPVRTSTGMSFGPTTEDLVIRRINRRLARVTGTRVDWGEPLHILHYAPGQEYRPHVDALPGVANQRQWTVLVYLNDGYAGGGTRFDKLGIEFSGREGDALIFRNVDDEGRGEPMTQHAGLPVTQGAKWLATRWIRQAPYHPWSGEP
jgi:prolyl 4-hydroxylase